MKSFLLPSCALLISTASLVASSPVLFPRASDSCPANVLSCSGGSSNSCCSPKYGLLVLVQQWITDYGPPDAFTLHGLWPDTCNGGQTGNSGCDSSRAYSDVGSIIQSGNPSLYNQMNTYWPSYKGDNSEFWTHEWDKHGTCVSTLDPSCFGSSYEQYEDMYTYFGQVLELRQKYDLYSIFSNANITPGDGSVSISDLESAIQSSIGVQPKISCHDGAINEVWIYFNVQGPNTYVPIDSVESSTCSGSTTYPSKNS